MVLSCGKHYFSSVCIFLIPHSFQTSLTAGQKLDWVQPSSSSPGQALELLHSSSF